MSRENILDIWTVYDSPKDMPGRFVARRFEIRPDAKDPVATDEHYSATDLEMIRRYLSEIRGLTPLARSEGDEPHIVECWL